jgi:hypothetical protein
VLVTSKKLHPNVRQFLVPLLEGTGLTNIETRDILILPGGRAQLQRKLVKNVYLGFRSIRPALLKEGILTAPAFASLMRGIQEEMLQHGISWTVTAAWGKRP